jgi:hypothetical protein
MIFTLLLAASVMPQPLVRVGGCPLGYYTSGAYCTPSPLAPRFETPPIQRSGATCPLGYYKSSNYCIPTSR